MLWEYKWSFICFKMRFMCGPVEKCQSWHCAMDSMKFQLFFLFFILEVWNKWNLGDNWTFQWDSDPENISDPLQILNQRLAKESGIQKKLRHRNHPKSMNKRLEDGELEGLSNRFNFLSEWNLESSDCCRRRNKDFDFVVWRTNYFRIACKLNTAVLLINNVWLGY